MPWEQRKTQRKKKKKGPFSEEKRYDLREKTGGQENGSSGKCIDESSNRGEKMRRLLASGREKEVLTCLSKLSHEEAIGGPVGGNCYFEETERGRVRESQGDLGRAM